VKRFSWIVLIAAIGGAAAMYFWGKSEAPQRPAIALPASEPHPPIRYPIEEVAPQAQSLPPVAESDETVAAALRELFGARLGNLLIPDEVVRRFVATVDNLTHDHLASRLMPVRAPVGIPLTAGAGENLTLAPENVARYGPYMRLVEAVPAEGLVAVYARFYPLLQQQYEALGYPDRYFNDRVVAVIDHLLATPEVQRAQIIQRRVLYEFMDPALEALSAGQKLMLRIGPRNRSKVKAKLLEIRQALTSKSIAAGPPVP
jgi:hypothetical protein